MSGTRICKICGKEYPYCKTHVDVGMFRWQDVACSPEHATLYFEAIARSRGELPEEKAVPSVEVEEEAVMPVPTSTEEKSSEEVPTEKRSARKRG